MVKASLAMEIFRLWQHLKLATWSPLATATRNPRHALDTMPAQLTASESTKL
jgi:hypothetical protein